jgi:hypothetical protein
LKDYNINFSQSTVQLLEVTLKDKLNLE